MTAVEVASYDVVVHRRSRGGGGDLVNASDDEVGRVSILRRGNRFLGEQ